MSETLFPDGIIHRAYSVFCAICGGSCTIIGQRTKRDAERHLRSNGWRWSKRDGWRCAAHSEHLGVLLQSAGERRISVIKVLRDHLGLPLKNAVSMANGAPTRFEVGSPQQAIALAEALRAVGAVAVVRR